MKHFLILVFIIPLGLSSCKKNKIDGRIKKDSELAQELRNSPESITIGNNNLILSASIARDFMPEAEENGSKMTSHNELRTIDSVSILNSIELQKQYVIYGDEIWITDYTQVKLDNNYTWEGLSRNGPKWGPYVEVDVVCEFMNDGTTYRVLTKDQTIIKTE